MMKYPVAASEIQTHDLQDTRAEHQTTQPLCHMKVESRSKDANMSKEGKVLSYLEIVGIWKQNDMK